MPAIPEPLAQILGFAWNTNVPRRDLKETVDLWLAARPEWYNAFPYQLSVAIHDGLDPQQYRKLTSNEYIETKEDVVKDLRQLWRAYYGQEFNDETPG